MKLLLYIIVMAVFGYLAEYLHGILTDNWIKKKINEDFQERNGSSQVCEQH